MLNARNRLVTRFTTLLALAVAPALIAVSADDQGGKDAPMDMNARMQQKLNSKLDGKIGSKALDMDSKLSERVNQKNAEANQKLDSNADALTAADRSGKSESEEETAESRDAD